MEKKLFIENPIQIGKIVSFKKSGLPGKLVVETQLRTIEWDNIENMILRIKQSQSNNKFIFYGYIVYDVSYYTPAIIYTNFGYSLRVS